MRQQSAHLGRLTLSAAFAMAFSAGPAPSIAQQGESIAARFGAREPRTCADTKAPAGNAITPALAARYFACKAEELQGNTLYLVENVKVEVGGGVPYTPNLGSFPSINVKVPLLPIRGSYLGYQCADLVRQHSGPPSTSCNVYNHTKATGYCYKTTFDDWSCYMADPAAAGNRAYTAPGPKG